MPSEPDIEVMCKGVKKQNMHVFASLDLEKRGKLNWPQVWNHLKEQAPVDIPEGTEEYDEEEAVEAP